MLPIRFSSSPMAIMYPSGTGNGQFYPNNTCTRGQIALFLYKAIGDK